jgi:NACHT domain
MPKKKNVSKLVDSVRASRDGHEFHETWAARKALQLLLPTDNLVGIAIEGLSPVDQASALSETVEIADLAIYYGKQSSFKQCQRKIIQQFKYSVSRAQKEFSESDSRKTVRKFVKTFRHYNQEYGENAVKRKLEFEIVTNRPISSAFREAVICIASNKPAIGPARKQAKNFKSTCGLPQAYLAEFARKLTVTGLAGSLRNNKGNLSRTLVDWSASTDTIAAGLLFGLVQLVRDKAGTSGEGANVIRRTDVLGALGLQSESDLLPCPASFPKVGPIVLREQLSEVLGRIPRLNRPLLIHAAGGVGKTVFLQSLYKALRRSHHCIIFDCFGGGAYRSPSDGRHLPRRGLIHLLNSLACDGLCDPLLPGNANVEDLFRTAHRRIKNTVATLQRASRKRQLLIFIDAIDNAAEYAKEKHEKSFPTLLLEHFHYEGQIPGVRLIVSSRTHRKDSAKGLAECEEFELKPFSFPEGRQYLQTHLQAVTETEIQVAYARSEGNPRILEHLASDRGLLDPSLKQDVIKLDDLIQRRLEEALKEAVKQGYKEIEINEFLAGLSVLPPPVPLNEYASIQEMEFSAIESFATDLVPLLERTKYGVVFRDEPTETLIREKYGSDLRLLHKVATRLYNKQSTSIYAAGALPRLLQKIGEGNLLFDLAFDERFPESIRSVVGKRAIRYARLKAAVMHSAQNREYDQLASLLVELSTVAAVNQRGTEFILDNPDLAVAFGDVIALRRLFEARTTWPGARYSRQAIAHSLLAEFNEAMRSAIAASEWIFHFYRRQDPSNRRDESRPSQLDLAAVPLALILNNRVRGAISFLKEWKDWYAYELTDLIFRFLRQAQSADGSVGSTIKTFITSLKTEIGALTGALSFADLGAAQRRSLIIKLARACEKHNLVETSNSFQREHRNEIDDGLLKAAAIALSMNMLRPAKLIAKTVSDASPRLSEFARYYSEYALHNVFSFVCRTVISAAGQNEILSERMILPRELIEVCSEIPAIVTGNDLRAAIKAELESRWQKETGNIKEDRVLTYEHKQEIEQFVNEKLESLVTLTQTFSDLVRAPQGKAKAPFIRLVAMWTELRRIEVDSYEDRRRGTSFFGHLVQRLLTFVLWSREDLGREAAQQMVAELDKGKELASSFLIEVVSLFSKKTELHDLAGSVAVKARMVIEREDDIPTRAASIAALARAILPASIEEASTYFQNGLDQIDAIGSGDYSFTNELLLFASALKGQELAETDFHTLTNICELNLPYEEEKFAWSAFAHAMSKTSGCRGLAKLARWDDRSKVSLDCSLLPYLIALIDDGKIAVESAISLLRLTSPLELWWNDTAALIAAIHRAKVDNTKLMISEVVRQYRENNPGYFSSSLWEVLGPISAQLFGEDAEETKTWAQLSSRHSRLREEEDSRRNTRDENDVMVGRVKRARTKEDEISRKHIRQLASKTSAVDELSVAQAIAVLKATPKRQDRLEAQFLAYLRAKVKFSDRLKYTQVIAQVSNLSLYAKLEELDACKEQWRGSVAALDNRYKEIGLSLLRTHTDELVSNDYLSNFTLKRISELSTLPMGDAVLELIKIFSDPDLQIPASVWLGLGVVACGEAKEGVGQLALKRLFNSTVTKLTSSVADGAWQPGLYPSSGDETEIIAGLIWYRLGSPAAADRWRAAHSIRRFAQFEKWEVIDQLVSKLISAQNALPFQAPELKFYILHAKLWLLIALGRIALDKPKQIVRYAADLRNIAMNEDFPHLLLRHFAGQILLTCEERGEKCINPEERNVIGKYLTPIGIANISDRVRDKRANLSDVIVGEKAERKFYLEYDFEKYDVANLAETFGKPTNQTKQSLEKWVHSFDPKITSMYETGGKSDRTQNPARGMSSTWHRYGEQLGWHGLNLVAGEYIARYPVVEQRYRERPWQDWLKPRLLTRSDGLWLADGIDHWPLELHTSLLEGTSQKLSVTGDQQKLLALIGFSDVPVNEVVVVGNWRSLDGIDVYIHSALVNPLQAKALAQKTARETAYFSHMPVYEHDEEETTSETNSKKDFMPWIRSFSPEAGLDGSDQLGAVGANGRLRLSNQIISRFSLRAVDSFNRKWVNMNSVCVARAETWLRGGNDDGRVFAERLLCTTAFLRDVLKEKKADLLVLIKLRRYEKNYSNRVGASSYTTAVVRIDQALSFDYFEGVIDKRHDTER